MSESIMTNSFSFPMGIGLSSEFPNNLFFLMSNCVIRIDFYTDNSTLFLHICSISITSGKFSWILYFIIFFCFNNLFFNMELPIIKVIKLLYHLLSNLLNIFILFRLFKENTLIYELLDMFFFHSSSFCLWIIFASFLKMPLSMKVWTMLYRAIQGGRVMVESSDKRVPLEKGMANHFSILALRSPWTVWKGKKIGHWKMNSPGW